MTRDQRFRYEMLVRARDFGKEHQPLFPEASMGGRLFAAVATAVQTIQQYLVNRVVATGEARKLKTTTRAAVYEYMKAIVATARRATVNETGSNPFQLPRRKAVSAIISSARAFIAEAKPREAEFVMRGLPATFLADFGTLVDELDKAATAQLNSRTERRLASAGIEETLEQGLETIRELDVFVPNTLRLDPVRREAWRAARRIEAVYQPDRKKTPAAASSETVAPASRQEGEVTAASAAAEKAS